jgi:hypothetical protein
LVEEFEQRWVRLGAVLAGIEDEHERGDADEDVVG